MIATGTDSGPWTETADVPGQARNVLDLFRNVLSLARRNTIRARNVGRDITHGLRNLAGCELEAYSSLLSDARVEVFSWMEAVVSELGADAVVKVQFEPSQITDRGAGMLAYGTAVRLA